MGGFGAPPPRRPREAGVREDARARAAGARDHAAGRGRVFLWAVPLRGPPGPRRGGRVAVAWYRVIARHALGVRPVLSPAAGGGLRLRPGRSCVRVVLPAPAEGCVCGERVGRARSDRGVLPAPAAFWPSGRPDPSLPPSLPRRSGPSRRRRCARPPRVPLCRVRRLPVLGPASLSPSPAGDLPLFPRRRRRAEGPTRARARPCPGDASPRRVARGTPRRRSPPRACPRASSRAASVPLLPRRAVGLAPRGVCGARLSRPRAPPSGCVCVACLLARAVRASPRRDLRSDVATR